MSRADRDGVLDRYRRRADPGARYALGANTGFHDARAVRNSLERSRLPPAAERDGDSSVRAGRHERDDSVYTGGRHREPASRRQRKHSGDRRPEHACERDDNTGNDNAAERRATWRDAADGEHRRQCDAGAEPCAAAAADVASSARDISGSTRGDSAVHGCQPSGHPWCDSAALHARHRAGCTDDATGHAEFTGDSRYDGAGDVESSSDP
jgi:hypothetical protein